MAKVIIPAPNKPELEKVADYDTSWLADNRFSLPETVSSEENRTLIMRFWLAHLDNLALDSLDPWGERKLTTRRQEKLPISYSKRRFGRLSLFLANGNGLQAILSEDRTRLLTPKFDELSDISHDSADIVIEGTHYVLHSEEDSPLIREASKHVPDFLLREAVTISRKQPIQSNTPSREIIFLQNYALDTEEPGPIIKSDSFGFKAERSDTQQSATELFESLGRQILSTANQTPELQEQLDNLDSPIIALPGAVVNEQSTMMLLSTSDDETISLVHLDEFPLWAEAWRAIETWSNEEEADSSSDSQLPDFIGAKKKGIGLPKDKETLDHLQLMVACMPRIHITRRTKDGEILFTVDGEDIVDHDPRFQNKLEEMKSLAAQYFEKGNEKPVTFREQRVKLAEQRKITPRSLGRKILDWFSANVS